MIPELVANDEEGRTQVAASCAVYPLGRSTVMGPVSDKLSFFALLTCFFRVSSLTYFSHWTQCKSNESWRR